MQRPSVLLAILLAVASPAAIVEHAWRADVTAPAAAQFPIGRGETIALRCDLVDRSGASVALPAGTEAAMYWQTNGMGYVWHAAPATVSNSTLRATWLPEYDPGAPFVRLFLSAEAPDGAIAHRAFANLRFYETPGTDPDVVPVPERVIDLAPIAAITNSPWARAVSDMAARSSAESATNAVSDAMAAAVAENPVESTLEVHRLVLADLWDRVDRIPGSSDADAIADLWLAVESLDARVAALEASSSRLSSRLLSLSTTQAPPPTSGLQADGIAPASSEQDSAETR